MRLKELLPYLSENAPFFIVDNGVRFSIDSPLAEACFYRFVDEICGASEGAIDVWLCQEGN